MPQLTPSQFQRIERLFFEASQLPPSERNSFLDNSCDDDDVREEVRNLLRHASDAGNSVEQAASAVPTMLSQAVARGAARAVLGKGRGGKVPEGPALLRELIGTRVGAYEFTDVLGQGGMGVVYLARDVRLGRSVAIKAVPPLYAADPLRLSRFLREAKILASLSHPNIATVYGLEESAGAKYLVMERVEGQTLAQRLQRGAIAIEEALSVGASIAAGVAAAHAAGVVHRDLKPANVIFAADGTVKVLDFGLAREVPAPSGTGNTVVLDDKSSGSGAGGPPITREGAVLGTPGYMSPEQVRGRPVDQRTDVFSLACILFECLTGRVAFPGETGADVIASVLERDPDWDLLPRRTPRSVRRLLVRCFAKDPADRMRDMGDVRLELEEAVVSREWTSGTSASRISEAAALPEARRGRGRVLTAALVALPWLLLVVVGTAAAVAWLRPRPVTVSTEVAAPVRRFAVGFPNNSIQSDLSHVRLDLSPDGSNLVVSASDGREQHLWVRHGADPDFHKVDGTLDGWIPAFSPDGESIVYFDGGVMRKRRLASTAPPAKITDVPGYWGGYHWGSDGYISYVASWSKGIARVSDRGGEPVFVTTPHYDKGEFAHLTPTLLTDDSAMLFAVWNGKNDTRIDAINLTTRQTHTVVEKGSTPRVASTPAGPHLLWERAGTIYAAPFDAKALKLTGPEKAIVDGVLTDRVLFQACYDVADDGTLAYVPGPTFAEESRLAWVDAASDDPVPDIESKPFSEERMSFVDPHFSSDQTRLSVVVKGDVYRPYVYYISRGTLERVIVEGDCASAAISPDGQKIAYSTNKDGPYALWVRSLGGGEEEKVLETPGDYPCTIAWAPDGKALTFSLTPAGTASRDVWVLDLETKTKRPFCQTPADERSPRISPTGNWLAYVSNASGQREVYIKSYPDGQRPRQVSTEGGDWPEWSPDGRKLYFRNKKGLHVATVARQWAGNSKPALVYSNRFGQSDVDLPDYTVAPDGRLLVIEPSDRGPRVNSLQFVLNWHKLLAPHR